MTDFADSLNDASRDVTFEEISKILDVTIKEDYEAKMLCFAAMLLSQTEEDQINIGFQSDSSTGKSYIPLELAKYFPKDEVTDLGGASPTSFFHGGIPLRRDDAGEICTHGPKCKDCKISDMEYLVDYERKTVIFLDMPDYRLLEKLRSNMSHDKKYIRHDITDKSKSKGGNRTKRVYMKGYFTVIFCTTKMNPDEQERTRLVILSPSCNQEKLEAALELIALKKCDPAEYDRIVLSDTGRKWLINRIAAIRATGIRNVEVPNAKELVLKRFRDKHAYKIPRHQRDFPRIINLIKAHALLNCFSRKRTGETIKANQTDIDAGFALYEPISESNELGLSPAVYEIYTEIFLPTGSGLRYIEYQRAFVKARHKPLTTERFKDVLSQLESAGLANTERDPIDGSHRIVNLVNVPEKLQAIMAVRVEPEKATKEDEFWKIFDISRDEEGLVSRDMLLANLPWSTKQAEKFIDALVRAQKLLENQAAGILRYSKA